MNTRLMTDMADANGFNIKKMAANVCSSQCIMDNTGSLSIMQYFHRFVSVSRYLYSANLVVSLF